MAHILAKFDGQKIELPDELRGAAPGNVFIVYPAASSPDSVSTSSFHSFRDFFGKGGTNRTAQDIDAQIHEEHDSWDEL